MSAELLSNPVDYVLLGGVKTPGLAEVVGAKAAYEYTVAQMPYSTGARATFRRTKLAEFEVRIKFYESSELIDFETLIRPMLKAPDTRAVISDPKSTDKNAVKALDIFHPLLEDLGINAVIVTEVLQFERFDDTGVWLIVIKMMQYVGLPKLTLAKVAGTLAAPLSPEEQLALQLIKENERIAQGYAGPIPPPPPLPTP